MVHPSCSEFICCPTNNVMIQTSSKSHLNVGGLLTFRALYYFIADFLAFFNELKTIQIDRVKVCVQVCIPLSGAITPKPIPALNHLTVPVAMRNSPKIGYMNLYF